MFGMSRVDILVFVGDLHGFPSRYQLMTDKLEGNKVARELNPNNPGTRLPPCLFLPAP